VIVDKKFIVYNKYSVTCYSAVRHLRRFVSPDIKVSLFILSLSLLTMPSVSKKIIIFVIPKIY